MIETRWLYSYLALCQEQNFTRAAQLLHITQPALTKQIQLLEEELNTQLIIRDKKKISFTQNGLAFRSQAREIVQLMDKAQMSFYSAQDSSIEGDFYFGCAESASMNFISRILKKLNQRYPKVRIHLQSGNAMDLYEKLDAGLLDCTLMINPQHHAPFEYLPLPLKDRFGILYSPEYYSFEQEKLYLKDLANIPLYISRQEESENPVLKEMVENLFMAGTYNLIFNAAWLVHAGMGCALCLEDLIAPRAFSNLKFKVIEDYPTAQNYIVFRRWQHKSFAMGAFLEFLQEESEELKN